MAYIAVLVTAELQVCNKCWCVVPQTYQGLHDRECKKKND